MEYDNTNSGVLFVNDRKETDKQPDYTGRLNVEGKTYDLACWNKTSKRGNAFLSVKISEPFRKEDKREVTEEEMPF